MPEDNKVHGSFLQEPQQKFDLHSLGYGTIAVATLLFAFGIWQHYYFFAVAIVLAEIMMMIWVQQGPTIASLIKWLVVLGVLLGTLYYVLFMNPEVFLLIDTYVLPHSSAPANYYDNFPNAGAYDMRSR